jgi:hypothetical protein
MAADGQRLGQIKLYGPLVKILIHLTFSPPPSLFFPLPQLADQGKVGTAEVHYNGQSWTGHVSLGRSPSWIAGCSYLQAITPAIVLGGSARWDMAKDIFSPAFVGSYDEGDNLLAAKYDTTVHIHQSTLLPPPFCTMYLLVASCMVTAVTMRATSNGVE